MAHDRIREEIITDFFLNTCKLRPRANDDDVRAWCLCVVIAALERNVECQSSYIPLITGSVAEFYIEPMLSCVGDVDVMFHFSDDLAIPAGYTSPRQLPGEFDSRVKVYEIVNSEFPGYVYLWLSYLLTENVDNGKYRAVQPMQRERLITTHVSARLADDSWHGPALVREVLIPSLLLAPTDVGLRVTESLRIMDNVFCVRCLTWPPQAAHWPTRHRNYGWPDSATVDRVVSNGCDVVGVAHPRCRQDEWMSKHQWRLSFSRAEIVLLNSWMPVQQIVYHILRVFMKTERLTANSSGARTLSNYHIKTLMLWACELKAKSWWIDDLNLVRICVELLHTLAAWLNNADCQHYFINNCIFFDPFENPSDVQVKANRLMLITTELFCEWCIDNYIYQCSEFCPSSVSRLFQDASFRPRDGLHRVVCLQNAVSAIVKWRLDMSPELTVVQYISAQWHVMQCMRYFPLTLRSCLCCMVQLANMNKALRVCLTAAVFLHVVYKITETSLTDEMLDILATACLQSNDARRCIKARHSSVLSLSQAAVLMKVVASNSRSTVQQIEIELAKAYLHRALTCKDYDSNSIYCVANVYLSVLYYITGQHQTAIDHCALATRLQDHSQCSSHVVQGELLPRIDDQIDILGLAVFYEYIRAVALNKKRERPHVTGFTTELFAHYLHIKFLSVTKCHQLPQTSLTDAIRQYQNCVCNSRNIFVTDVMVYGFASRAKYLSNDRLLTADRGKNKSLMLSQLDTSKLVELLQQSAVEHLTTCRELEARYFDSFLTPDFKALYAYKCGQYQHCLQLSVRNVLMLIADKYHWCLFVSPFPGLISLMDDDIVSLIGLTALIHQSSSNGYPPLVYIHQLSLSLYLMTQCQIKLRHSVTSLATTLHYVRLARSFSGQMRKFAFAVLGKDFGRPRPNRRDVFIDLYLLQFVEQKLLRCIPV